MKNADHTQLESPTRDQWVRWGITGIGALAGGLAIYKLLTRFDVAGKVVLVTGGSRGLGLELARQLALKKARVVICARSDEELRKAKDEFTARGFSIQTIPADLTDHSAVKSMISEIVQTQGRIDVLINNAGIIQVGPEETMTLEDYEEAMDINFWAPLYCMHEVLPYFLAQGGGRIVNITSIGGKVAVPHLLPYTASKFALVGLSEGMHAELRRKNIIVTTVVPNLMRTGSPRNASIKGDHEKEYAWFKFADSLPLLSQDVRVAAKKIIRALEFGNAEKILTATARLAVLSKGFAPGWMTVLFSLINRWLPEGDGSVSGVKGYEAESALSNGRVSQISNKAALRNNEV